MSKAKEQLAATLLNHWFVVSKILSLGRKKRHPASKRYAQLSSIDTVNDADVAEIIKSFSAFNAKHFIENLKFQIDQAVSDGAGLTVKWAPKILVRGLSGTLILDVEYGVASAVLSALNFARQSPAVAASLEFSDTVSPHDTSQSSMGLLIPGFKNSPFSNMSREYSDFLRTFLSKLMIAKVIALVNSSITEDLRRDLLETRVNILVTTEEHSGVCTPISFSVEETDAVKAARIARERLAELRRRRVLKEAQSSMIPAR